MPRTVATIMVALAAQLCAGQALVEGFDGAGFPPRGWSVWSVDTGVRVWLAYSNTPISSPRCAAVGAEQDLTYSDDWLCTRGIFPDGADTLLSFWLNARPEGDPESLEVRVSVTDDRPASCTTIIYAASLRSPRWQQVSLSLAAFAGKRVRVGFRVCSRGGYGSVRLEDVSGPAYPERDIGCVSLVQPRSNLETAAVVWPRVRVTNYGSEEQSGFPVALSLVDTLTHSLVYCDTAEAGTVLPDSDGVAVFADSWVPVAGTYRAVARALLGGDLGAENDSLVSLVRVMPGPIHDASATAVVEPVNGRWVPTALTPRVRLRNLGTVTDSVPATMVIDLAGAQRYTGTTASPPLLGVDRETTAYLPNWSPTAGYYRVRA